MKLILSLPPTTNSTYKVGRGHMYKSEKAKEWSEEAFSIIKMDTHHERFTGKVGIIMISYIKHDRDFDGGIKLIADVLQLAQVVKNDSQIYPAFINRIVDAKEKPRVEVFINGLDIFYDILTTKLMTSQLVNIDNKGFHNELGIW